MKTHEQNRATYNRVAAEYARMSDLFLPERSFLKRTREQIHQMDVLDIGVGGGRTTYTFAALARSYTGIDYASQMAEICRRRFGDEVPFHVVDAANMSRFADASFDLVIFSHNGIDYFDIDTRRQCLGEVRRVLRPGGIFFFSTHALESFPWIDELPSPLRPIAFARNFVWNARRRSKNRHVDLAAAKQRGWTYLEEGSHSFGLRTIYSTRAHQLAELESAGFAIEAVYALDGREIGSCEATGDTFIHYTRKRA